MKREGSLPHSKQPAFYSYPEPQESSRCPPSHFLKTHCNIILPFIPRSSKCFFPLRFPHLNSVCTYPRPLHATSPDHLIILNLFIRIMIGKEYRSQRSSLCSLLQFQVGRTASYMEKTASVWTSSGGWPTRGVSPARGLDDIVTAPHRKILSCYEPLTDARMCEVQCDFETCR